MLDTILQWLALCGAALLWAGLIDLARRANRFRRMKHSADSERKRREVARN
jgi:hypothetical protein